MTRKILLGLLMLNASFCFSQKKPPDKIVVLSFDDASQSHYSYVAPLLKKYGFGATFYVCEYPPDFSDTVKYMSWTILNNCRIWDSRSEILPSIIPVSTT